jgi:uncharacterized membrane protein YfcA
MHLPLDVLLSDLVLYALAGAAAGFLGGLLGIGGGLLIVAALTMTLPTSGVVGPEIIHVAVGTSLAGMVLTFGASTIAHYRTGNIMAATWLRLAPGMVIGTLIGTQLEGFMSGRALRLAITFFCAVTAWRMGFSREKTQREHSYTPSSYWLFPSGIGIATVSSIVGIGGGSLTVPLLISLGVKPVRAVATSAACGLVIACAAAALNMILRHPATHAVGQAEPWGLIGTVYLPAAITAAFASTLTARAGVRVANRLSGQALKRSFAIFLLIIGGIIAAGG